MYVYIYLRIYTYTHTYTHTYLYIYVYIYTHTYIHTYIHTGAALASVGRKARVRSRGVCGEVGWGETGRPALSLWRNSSSLSLSRSSSLSRARSLSRADAEAEAAENHRRKPVYSAKFRQRKTSSRMRTLPALLVSA